MKSPRVLGWSILALALILALVVGGGAYGRFLRDKNEGLRLANEGRQALGAQEIDKAIAQFDAALSKPLDARTKAEIFALRGRARDLAGNSDAAITDLTQSLRFDQNAGAAYAERARAYQTKGEPTKALSDYDAAIAHGAKGPENYFARGSLLLANGQAAKAAADFTEVTQRSPDNLDAFLFRARASAAANDLDGAIASYESALRIDPKNQEAHAERGDLYSKRGDIGKAMEDYAELRTPMGEASAARSAETSAPVATAAAAELLDQANTAQSSGHLDEATALYNRVLQMNIPLLMASTALQDRGNVYHRQGDDERAMQDYQQAIRFNPANAGAYANRGLIYAIRNEPRAAIMDYNEALRFEPRMYEALFNRGLTYRDDGDLDSALRDLTAAITANETAAPAYLNRATVFLKQEKPDQAMADLNAAIKYDPESAEAYLVRSQIFSKKRDYAREIQDLEKAASLKTKTAYVALNGLAWLRATCPEKSIRDGKKAVAEALRACELSGWAEGGTVDTLAAAYAENGEFEKAANFQMFALTLPGISAEDRAPAEERVKLYQSRRPYRETKPH